MTDIPRYTLSVRVSLRDQYGRNNLEVSEDLQVEVASFLEVAKILGLFHDLAQSLKAAKT